MTNTPLGYSFMARSWVFLSFIPIQNSRWDRKHLGGIFVTRNTRKNNHIVSPINQSAFRYKMHYNLAVFNLMVIYNEKYKKHSTENRAIQVEVCAHAWQITVIHYAGSGKPCIFCPIKTLNSFVPLLLWLFHCVKIGLQLTSYLVEWPLWSSTYYCRNHMSCPQITGAWYSQAFIPTNILWKLCWLHMLNWLQSKRKH